VCECVCECVCVFLFVCVCRHGQLQHRIKVSRKPDWQIFGHNIGVYVGKSEKN